MARHSTLVTIEQPPPRKIAVKRDQQVRLVETHMPDAAANDNPHDEIRHQIANLHHRQPDASPLGKLAKQRPPKQEAHRVSKSIPTQPETGRDFDGERVECVDDGCKHMRSIPDLR